jgi:hypothetical protein
MNREKMLMSILIKTCRRRRRRRRLETGGGRKITFEGFFRSALAIRNILTMSCLLGRKLVAIYGQLFSVFSV